ncbi:hypothetical protein ElyMa_001150900 [Elysia marginata]|uniref:Uncharacterized protein n=1 Tax=Elysia marginata TaxID=1093978 RepID=A0AAV4I1K7_9GAST|nr:hypothetical protein ElyMa_001150900 [Elysia marginata]
MSDARKMCANSISQGLNVDLPKAGLELRTYRPESRASTSRPYATQEKERKAKRGNFELETDTCLIDVFRKQKPIPFSYMNHQTPGMPKKDGEAKRKKK